MKTLEKLAENFINSKYPAKFHSFPRLAWEAGLRKTKVILDFLTNIDVLLMVEKEIRIGLCHCINRFAKAENKYMKYYDKIKECSYFKYSDVNSLYGWTMLQKLSGKGFKCVKNVSEFNKDFI